MLLIVGKLTVHKQGMLSGTLGFSTVKPNVASELSAMSISGEMVRKTCFKGKSSSNFSTSACKDKSKVNVLPNKSNCDARR